MNEKSPYKKRFIQGRTVGAWMVNPGLTVALLLIGITALISYVNPVLFANVAALAPGLVGAAMGMGLLSALGGLIFFVAAAALFFYRAAKKNTSGTNRMLSFVFWLAAPVMNAKKGHPESILLLVGFVSMAIMAALSLHVVGILDPFYDVITQSLLSGVKALAELKGLAFLTTAFSPGVVHVMVQLCVIFAPIILAELGGTVVSWVKKHWLNRASSLTPVFEVSEGDKAFADRNSYWLLRANENFTAQERQELSVKQGNLLWSTGNSDEGRLQVLTYDGAKSGWVPLNSVTVIYKPPVTGDTGENPETSETRPAPIITYEYTREELDTYKKTGKYLAVAIFDFEGDTSQSQLSFEVNEHIWVLDARQENDWWIGEMKTPKPGQLKDGYFPKTYIQVLPLPPQQKQQTGSPLSQPEQKGGDSHTPDAEDDLPPPQTKHQYQYTSEDLEIANKTGRYLVVALFDFKGIKEQHQLSFNSGEHIWVTESHPDEDWWTGEMKTPKDGQLKEGYFPKNHVQVVPRKLDARPKSENKSSPLFNSSSSATTKNNSTPNNSRISASTPSASFNAENVGST
jgi:hypothetical protein